MGADDAALAHLGIVEDRGAHADKRTVSDRAAVDNRTVTDGHVASDDGIRHSVRCVNEHVLLQVRSFPDSDLLDVTAQHDVEEH